jgi:uncharacterized protein with GYD domain
MVRVAIRTGSSALPRVQVHDPIDEGDAETHILLANFTDQGIHKIKDSPKRADAFKDMAKKCGAT